MEQVPKRAWYKKKRYIIPAILFVAIVFGSSGSSTSPTPVTSQTTAVVQSLPQHPPTTYKNTSTYPTQENLSNNNYYTNSVGSEVHSPAYSNSIPSGASAQCRDGTYSFSQSRRGTCSHHGGVASWL